MPEITEKQFTRWARVFFTAFFVLLTTLVLLEISLHLMGWSFYQRQISQSEANLSPGAIRILCLGESTTAARQIGGYYGAWTTRLQQRLDEEYGINKFAVINAARPSIVSPLLVRHLPELLGKYRPHLVITMMGINDNVATPLISDAVKGKPKWQPKLVKLWYWLRYHAGRDHPVVRRHECDDIYVCRPIWSPENIFKEFLAWRGADFEKVGDTLFQKLSRKWNPEFFFQAGMRLRKIMVGLNVKDVAEIQARRRSVMQFFQEAVERNPNHLAARLAVAEQANHLRETELCLEQLREVEVRGGSLRPDFELTMKMNCSRQAGLPVEDLEREGLKPTDIPVLQRTRESYRYVHDLLGAQNIPWIMMQYPLLRADILGYLISDSDEALSMQRWFREASHEVPAFRGELPENVYLLENKRQFERAVAEKGFDAVFVDQFAEEFGHTTPWGDDLIAVAVLRKIQELYPPESIR